MAVQDIPLGTVLTDRMLGVRYMPEAYVEFRHIRARDAARIIGVRMSMEVKANESILWSDLATTTGERRDLSSLVRNGMRAITIRADATSGFGGLLRPGDRVDAFLTVSRSTDGRRPGDHPAAAERDRARGRAGHRRDRERQRQAARQHQPGHPRMSR
jgi:pilus assembly protein CpaB